MSVVTSASANVTSFTCKNCGATTSAVALGSSIRCPFCGSEHVIEAPVDSSAPRPEALLPFVFPDDQVDAVYRTWLGSGFFRAKDIGEKAHSHKMRAVYIPVWESSGDAESQWNAQAGYTEEIPAPPTPPGQSQSGNAPAPQTRTRWESASGRHSARYDRVLISASKGLPQDWLRRVGDLDWGQIKGYDANFLIGREVEQSNLDRAGALDETRSNIADKERQACSNLVPGDRQRDLRVNTTVANLATRLVYLPVWLASFQYGEKTYRCVVNGQSGKVDGEAPLDKTRIAGLSVLIVVIVVAIIIAVMLFS